MVRWHFPVGELFLVAAPATAFLPPHVGNKALGIPVAIRVGPPLPIGGANGVFNTHLKARAESADVFEMNRLKEERLEERLEEEPSAPAKFAKFAKFFQPPLRGSYIEGSHWTSKRITFNNMTKKSITIFFTTTVFRKVPKTGRYKVDPQIKLAVTDGTVAVSLGQYEAEYEFVTESYPTVHKLQPEQQNFDISTGGMSFPTHATIAASVVNNPLEDVYAVNMNICKGYKYSIVDN